MQSETRDHLHPSWCSSEHCRANSRIGEHRSEPLVVGPTGPMDARIDASLIQTANEDPADAVVVVALRSEYRDADGDVYSLDHQYLHVPAASELGRVLLELTATADRETS